MTIKCAHIIVAPWGGPNCPGCLRDALEDATGALFAISVTSLEMHDRVRGFARRAHEKAEVILGDDLVFESGTLSAGRSVKE
jgi:hypothetical protein